MSLYGIEVSKENKFYASYSDDCWVALAKEIMVGYANKYAYQVPTTAQSQLEYEELDEKTFRPIRMSILKNVMYGPLKNVADIPSIYRAFEERRIAYKQSMGIAWKDKDYGEEFR